MGQTLLMVLVSIVTVPFCARALPFRIVALLFMVMLVSARIFPSNEVLPKIPAEEPTTQNKPLSLPPFEPKLITLTDEPTPVVSAFGTWKTQYALLLPSASRE